MEYLLYLGICQRYDHSRRCHVCHSGLGDVLKYDKRDPEISLLIPPPPPPPHGVFYASWCWMWVCCFDVGEKRELTSSVHTCTLGHPREYDNEIIADEENTSPWRGSTNRHNQAPFRNFSPRNIWTFHPDKITYPLEIPCFFLWVWAFES